MKIWNYYLIKSFVLNFLYLILGFYSLFSLIDYAYHPSLIAKNFKTIFFHYLFVFSSSAEIFIPLGIVLSTLKTLLNFNYHYELVAVMNGGSSLKKILRPFLYVGILTASLLLINAEFALPHTEKYLKKISHLEKKRKKAPSSALTVNYLTLENGSLLLFQRYEPHEKRFYDLYWFANPEEIVKIKYLYPYTEIPRGEFVDVLKKNKAGELLHQTHHLTLDIPEIKFNSELLNYATEDAHTLSLSKLIRALKHLSEYSTQKEAQILTAFIWKMSIPWLCLLFLLIILPLCVSFNHIKTSPLLFYGLTFIGMLLVYFSFNSLQIITRRELASPVFTIFLPLLFLLLFFSWNYKKKISSIL